MGRSPGAISGDSSLILGFHIRPIPVKTKIAKQTGIDGIVAGTAKRKIEEKAKV
jgi:hypothetical protein